jgi:lipopolysaccharide exporter
MMALTSNNMSAYQALGRPHLTTTTLLVRLGVLAVAMGLLYKPFGVLGVAYAELLAASAGMLVSLPILLATIHLPWSEYVRALWRPLIGSALMGVAVSHIIGTAIPVSAGDAAMQMLLGVCTGVLCYPLILAALWFASGRPDSIEIQITRWAFGAVRTRLARDTAA